MRRTFIILASLFLLSQTGSFAQKPAPVTQPAQTDQSKVIVLKPVFEYSDVLFALNAIGSVEITGGTEVDAYLSCKNVLTQIVQAGQAANKKPTDKITAEIQLPVAQNILTLLNRAKFAGTFAERYKGFVNSLVESAKPYVQPQAAATEGKK